MMTMIKMDEPAYCRAQPKWGSPDITPPDAERFAQLMARCEILIARGLGERAIEVFRDFVNRDRFEVPDRSPTIDSPVCHVFPVRIARLLEDAGYETLRSVAAASDQQLLAIGNLAGKTLDCIRTVIADIRRGSPVRKYPFDDTTDVPDFKHAHVVQLQTSPTMEIERMNVSSTTIATAINTLLANKDNAVGEIDRQIAAHQEKIDALRAMRKMIAPVAKPKTDSRQYAGRQDLMTKIIELVTQRGPMSAKDIGESLSLDYAFVGRLAKRAGLEKIDGKLAIGK